MLLKYRLFTLSGFLNLTVGIGYQLSRFIIVAVFSFPVALIYIISALLLDSSVPEAQKHRLPDLLIDRFDQVFQYSVTLAMLLSVGVVVLIWFKTAKERLSLKMAITQTPSLKQTRNKPGVEKIQQGNATQTNQH
jgi:hypothetical protein